MTPVPLPPPPGSMTVPPWFGWEEIVALLAVAAVAAIVAAVLLAAGRDAGGRSEWQAWLDGRSVGAGAWWPDSGPRPGTPAAGPERDEAELHR